MGKRNKLVDGMLIGALVGAAISLLDKETRTTVIHNGKRVGGKLKYAVQHPQEIADAVRNQIDTVKTAVDDVSRDIDYLRTKVSELKEATPQVLEIVNETKEVITKHLDSAEQKNKNLS
jgi:gas vesicle protein